MALILKDRVQETSTTTGTGTLTLAGAVTEFQTFSSAIGNGNTTYYTIYVSGGTDWEVGIGTVGAGTLSRDTVYASSNAGALVNFPAGTKYVFCDYPAGKAIYTDANGNISNLAGSISTANTIDFNTSYATALTAGQLGWDGNNTLGLGMAGGNVTQHIGEDQFFYCKATSAIAKGQVVMFTGSVGASGVPTGAPATGIADGTYIMGIAAEAIANNGFGLVQSFGTLRNVNTSGYADGEILWYDPAVTGGLTATKPSAPNVKVQMAAVINGGSSGGGTILIRINPGSQLGGTDSNAQISTPVNGQIITYDNTNGYWKNTTLTAGTGVTTTPSSTGVITITNTAPDQTVVLNNGTGISVTGTYPNFTITNTSPSSGGTVTSVAATAGTGISITGSPITSSGTLNITNTAPMTYPGAGIPNSTGSAWGTSYTTSGSGTIVALATGANFTNANFVGSSSALAAILTNAAEICTISATAATGTIVYYPSTQSVLYYTSNASANWTVNLTFSSGTTLNTAMTTGQSLTVVFLVTQGSTAYYNNVIQVDGTTLGVTTVWQGGAPSAGNVSGIDVYTYTIIKTGSATFTVLASQTQFK